MLQFKSLLQVIAPDLRLLCPLSQSTNPSTPIQGVSIMNTVDFSRRVSAKTIEADINSFHSMNFIKNYIPVRSEATPEALKAGYDAMRAKQQKETELLAAIKAASDAARLAEVEFHDMVMAMKETVRGQYGSNSDEAQAIGYKKKSEYKRPRRRSA
ncbi:MAG: hypothetical protein WBA99_07325 [Nodosilinea sp.]